MGSTLRADCAAIVQLLYKYMVRPGRCINCTIRGGDADLHGEIWLRLHLQSHQHASSLAIASCQCHVRQV